MLCSFGSSTVVANVHCLELLGERIGVRFELLINMPGERLLERNSLFGSREETFDRFNLRSMQEERVLACRGLVNTLL